MFRVQPIQAILTDSLIKTELFRDPANSLGISGVEEVKVGSNSTDCIDVIYHEIYDFPKMTPSKQACLGGAPSGSTKLKIGNNPFNALPVDSNYLTTCWPVLDSSKADPRKMKDGWDNLNPLPPVGAIAWTSIYDHNNRLLFPLQTIDYSANGLNNPSEVTIQIGGAPTGSTIKLYFDSSRNRPITIPTQQKSADWARQPNAYHDKIRFDVSMTEVLPSSVTYQWMYIDPSNWRVDPPNHYDPSLICQEELLK